MSIANSRASQFLFTKSTACAVATTGSIGPRFLNEMADGLGGAIASEGGLYIYNTSFEKCTSLFEGGAIWAGRFSNTSIWNSNFSYNSAEGDGGAIYSDGTLYVENSYFEGNTATSDSNIGGSAIVHGCGNEGIPSFSCSVGQGSAGNLMGLHDLAPFTLLMLLILLISP